jgi:hypothetical protein
VVNPLLVIIVEQIADEMYLNIKREGRKASPLKESVISRQVVSPPTQKATSYGA